MPFVCWSEGGGGGDATFGVYLPQKKVCGRTSTFLYRMTRLIGIRSVEEVRKRVRTKRGVSKEKKNHRPL